ncbi:hypothetical protein DSM3645_14740 [Blastopirellula marina DSM 3645]|uniref:Uncharacterized protein n=1 Tax=Blastopirellula marina DSM 3645 TaxID=314230 RepID=A3ZSF2_9BACT|nr:hypothetical protein DSM3645_14740 [Blastopirellula marina DSM 3645]
MRMRNEAKLLPAADIDPQMPRQKKEPAVEIEALARPRVEVKQRFLHEQRTVLAAGPLSLGLKASYHNTLRHLGGTFLP